MKVGIIKYWIYSRHLYSQNTKVLSEFVHNLLTVHTNTVLRCSDMPWMCKWMGNLGKIIYEKLFCHLTLRTVYTHCGSYTYVLKCTKSCKKSINLTYLKHEIDQNYIEQVEKWDILQLSDYFISIRNHSLKKNITTI